MQKLIKQGRHEIAKKVIRIKRNLIAPDLQDLVEMLVELKLAKKSAPE